MRKCGLTKEQKLFVLGKLKESYRALFYAFTDLDNGLNGRGYSKDLDQFVKELADIHALHGEIEGYDEETKDVSRIYLDAQKRAKYYNQPVESVIAKMNIMRELPDWAKE